MVTRALSLLLALSACSTTTPKTSWPDGVPRESAAPDPLAVSSTKPKRPFTPPDTSRDEPSAQRSCSPLQKRISIVVAGADLVEVLRFIANEAELNLVVDSDVRGVVTAELRNVTVGAALDALMKSHGLDATVENCILTANRQ